MFWLSESFISLQGEGRYAGVPSYFLRIGGCNLRCKGFGAEYEIDGQKRYGCDTWFAVDRAFSSQWRAIDSAELLLEDIERSFSELGYLPHVVITGGEPLIYASDPIFYGVIEGLIELGVQITIETNATLSPDFIHYPAYSSCTFALSIKLSNSAEAKERRICLEALESLATHAKEAFMKFALDRALIESGAALKEINELRRVLPKLEIYCMPVGESKETLSKNDRAVFEFCIRHNFRYSDRLHIRIFDTTLGV